VHAYIKLQLIICYVHLFLLLLTQISPLFIPLLHIGGNPFHHESEIPLAFDGENIHALEDVSMGRGALLGLYVFIFP
jgi:hypothetical protein